MRHQLLSDIQTGKQSCVFTLPIIYGDESEKVVDIENSSATMNSYKNGTEGLEVNLLDKSHHQFSVQFSNAFNGNEKLLGCGDQRNGLRKLRNEMEQSAEKLLKLQGLNVSGYKSYIFGKTVTFAICYGASTSHAISSGLRSVEYINLAEFASNKGKVSKFINNPDLFNTYNGVVSAVYSGDLLKAQELASNIWKKSLSKSIVEDSETLKNLIENGCTKPKHAVEYSKEQALLFVLKNLESLGLN